MLPMADECREGALHLPATYNTRMAGIKYSSDVFSKINILE